MPYWLTIAISLASFALAGVMGIALVPYLKKIHFGQTILDIGPKWHKKKQGTPIMGGFMFIFSSIITTTIAYIIYRVNYLDLTDGTTGESALKLLCTILYALGCMGIGFADDYIKAVKKQNLGLRPRQKLIFQILFSIAFLAALYALGDTETTLDLHFVQLELGLFYYPLMLLFMLFMTNAVNLTDGIDGLCGSVTIVSMLALSIICSYTERTGMNEHILYSVSIAGGCLGFLLWNLHPAKCFMGDTGSMYLGGAFVAISLVTRCHLLIVMIGIIYICEALSVVLQVISFKTTGKRIFKMSPIHHHFEMCGYNEYKIVILFSIVGLIFAALAVALRLMS